MPKKGYEYLKKTDVENPNFLLAEILYKELYKSEKKNGRYKEALQFYEKSIEIEKQTYFINNELQVRKFKEKLNVVEKDRQLAQLKNNKKNLTIGVIIVVNLFLMGAFFSAIFLKRKEKQLKKVESDIKTFTENEIYKINYARDKAVSSLKKQFSTQLHTNIGSILTATSSFLKTKKKLEINDEDKELWDDISCELQKVYNIIRNDSHLIYDSSFDNEKFLKDLDKSVHIIFSGQKISLHTNIHIEKGNNLTPEIKICFLSIIKESCTNIIKYSKAKNVYIDLISDSENIELSIKNDGKKSFSKISSGIGLIALENEVKSLSGNFTAKSLDDGYLIKAKIPYNLSSIVNLV